MTLKERKSKAAFLEHDSSFYSSRHQHAWHLQDGVQRWLAGSVACKQRTPLHPRLWLYGVRVPRPYLVHAGRLYK